MFPTHVGVIQFALFRAASQFGKANNIAFQGFIEENLEELEQYVAEKLFREGKIELPSAQEALVTMAVVGLTGGMTSVPNMIQSAKAKKEFVDTLVQGGVDKETATEIYQAVTEIPDEQVDELVAQRDEENNLDNTQELNPQQVPIDQYETPAFQRDEDTQFFTSLTPDEQESIVEYSGVAHEELNRTLVSGGKLNSYNKKLNDNLLTVIDKYEIKEPQTVYRGLGKTEAEAIKKLPVNGRMDIKGFYSTSTKEDIGVNFSDSGVVLQLEVPPGLGIGVDIGKAGSMFGSKEAEVLLKHGLSYTITEKTTTEINGRKVELIKGELNVENTTKNPTRSTTKGNGAESENAPKRNGVRRNGDPRGTGTNSQAEKIQGRISSQKSSATATAANTNQPSKSQSDTSKSTDIKLTEQDIIERVDDFTKADKFVAAFRNNGFTRPYLLELFQKEKRRLKNRSKNQKARDEANAKPNDRSGYKLAEIETSKAPVKMFPTHVGVILSQIV